MLETAVKKSIKVTNSRLHYSWGLLFERLVLILETLPLMIEIGMFLNVAFIKGNTIQTHCAVCTSLYVYTYP